MASKREGIMLCYPYSEKRFLTQYGGKALMQRKYNGDRCRAVCKDGHVILYSSQNNVIMHLSHINEELAYIANGSDVVFDGELYVHGWSHQQIHSVVSQKIWAHEKSAEMEYHVFDLINTREQSERIIERNVLFQKAPNKSVFRAPTWLVTDVDSIKYLYEEIVKEGYEGFILRSRDGLYKEKRSTDIMKCKPTQQSVARIIILQQQVSIQGELKEALGAFICLDEETGTRFKVGTGFSTEQRVLYWTMGNNGCAGKRVVYKYQELSDEGVPIFPVFVRMV